MSIGYYKNRNDYRIFVLGEKSNKKVLQINLTTVIA